MKILEIRELKKSFKKKKVLDNVSMSINNGDLFGIVGSSGSGKSVLMKILIGFLEPTSGTVISRGRIGFSMQKNSLYETLTLEENLNYFSKILNVENKKEIINNLLKKLSLIDYRKVLVKNLSGGTQKRADIACALLNNPEILILDEPFTGLDQILSSESSHLLNKISELCNKLILIKNRKLISIGKSQLRKPGVR